jgi:aquaporin related protein
MPKTIPVELEDDDYDEVYLARGNRRGPPTELPRRPSIGSSDYRLPYTRWMSKTLKGHFVAAMGEFVGTSTLKSSISYSKVLTI